MATVKTAALKPDVVQQKYLHAVGIRAKAVDAGSLGIEHADLAIYFPSLDQNSYPGIVYSVHPAANFQNFKLHVFPKDTFRTYFMRALQNKRRGQLTISDSILKEIINAVNSASGKMNPGLVSNISVALTRGINEMLASVPALNQYGVKPFPESAVKGALSKTEELQPAFMNAIYLNQTEGLDNIIYASVRVELPKHILKTSRESIFNFLTEGLNGKSKEHLKPIIGQVIQVDPKFQSTLFKLLSMKASPAQSTKNPYFDPNGEKQAAAVAGTAAQELDMYFSRIADDETVADICKEAVMAHLNEIYRQGVKDGGLGMFGERKDAESVEVAQITRIVHAVNPAAPELTPDDLDLAKKMSGLGDQSVSIQIIKQLQQIPDDRLETALGTSVDFAANIDATKHLIYALIPQVPEFAEMFANESGTPAPANHPAVTKTGDKINIVSLTNAPPSEYADWVVRIKKDLSNPRVIELLEGKPTQQ